MTFDSMSEWRRRAVEVFPELREDLEDPDTTIYDVFFDLLARVCEAHARRDVGELRRIYGYAEWCARQEVPDVWNAAGVAFYEHLVDDPVTYTAIPEWVPVDVFRGVSGLFEARLEGWDYQRLCEAYSKKHGPIETEPSKGPKDTDGPDGWSI